jgi:equilibrative nucleoside transporter 1/2/3
MDRLRKLWKGEQAYEPLNDGSTEGDGDVRADQKEDAFSYVEYSIFLLLGISMLWAWNMFLAAGPYFQGRFKGNNWIFGNFQAAEVSVSTVTNLVSMLILTRMQANASYPKRIISSLFINMVTFTMLAISTSIGASARGFFGFLMVMIFATSLATGLCQNGIFAYVSGFGQPKYTQGIMTGQAIAGVLPCIAQIVSVLSVQAGEDGNKRTTHTDGGEAEGPTVRSTAALAYFLTATAISVATLIAFMYLLARNRKAKVTQASVAPGSDEDEGDKKSIPLLVLFRKLFWLASGVFVTFGVTMLFPVFTQRILSVRPVEDQGAFTQPATFIPLAFLFWNTGDLLGRLMTAVPSLSLVHRPKVVFILAVSRVAWVGLYHLCNIRGAGAIVKSDFFYLVVVQLFFGLTNGYLGSICMIGAGQWVDPEEREAAGGFMGLMLVGGLAVGSLLSFFAAGA